MKQYDIFEVHAAENSETGHLEENRKHFNEQCELVFDLLMRGQKLSVISAMNEHKIMSLPRRILDLKESGVHISDEWVNTGRSKLKHYFFSPEDKNFNQKFRN